MIGLISGTSADGVDAALVDITGTVTDLTVDLIAAVTSPYPAALHAQIIEVIGGASISMSDLAVIDDAIAHQFAQVALDLQAGHASADLIGSHGQTVFHRPPVRRGKARAEKTGDMEGLGETTHLPKHNVHNLFLNPALNSALNSSLGYSLQLGRGDLIAQLTGITTISNFRAADIALGGEGAPLAPIVDACLLSDRAYSRCVQNLGGIGNVAYLPALLPVNPQSVNPAEIFVGVYGWDTGPGNTLIDLAVSRFSGGTQTYDQEGAWAAQGKPCQHLVQQWLSQDYFQIPPPKSTGREEFSAAYLERCLQDMAAYSLNHADMLATLSDFTAASIAHSYHTFLPTLPDQVLLCGGGSKNQYLRQRIQAYLDVVPVLTTDEVGLSADFKEAIAFAILAYWRARNIPGNLPMVTGAYRPTLLGDIHIAAQTHVLP